jgi:hypothetical protein
MNNSRIHSKKSWGYRIALGVDQLLNAILKGDEDETISSRAGKAAKKKKKWAIWLCYFLNKLDKDHCNRAIEEDEGTYGPSSHS